MARQKKLKSKTSSSEPEPPPPPWVELPWDITANILQRLEAEKILETAQKVCTTWRSVCKDPSMWRKIHLSSSRDSSRRLDFEIMCRHAVDRSHGQLLDISLAGFGSDSLLNYIAESSRGLRSLSLECCGGITGKGVIEATKGLPLLEDLHISLIPLKLCKPLGKK